MTVAIVVVLEAENTAPLQIAAEIAREALRGPEARDPAAAAPRSPAGVVVPFAKPKKGGMP